MREGGAQVLETPKLPEASLPGMRQIDIAAKGLPLALKERHYGLQILGLQI